MGYDAGRWLLLATLWSLQYLFLRIAVPVFGTAVVAEGRALSAALFLLPWVVWVARQRIGLAEHLRKEWLFPSVHAAVEAYRRQESAGANEPRREP